MKPAGEQGYRSSEHPNPGEFRKYRAGNDGLASTEFDIEVAPRVAENGQELGEIITGPAADSASGVHFECVCYVVHSP